MSIENDHNLNGESDRPNALGQCLIHFLYSLGGLHNICYLGTDNRMSVLFAILEADHKGGAFDELTQTDCQPEPEIHPARP